MHEVSRWRRSGDEAAGPPPHGAHTPLHAAAGARSVLVGEIVAVYGYLLRWRVVARKERVEKKTNRKEGIKQQKRKKCEEVHKPDTSLTFRGSYENETMRT